MARQLPLTQRALADANALQTWHTQPGSGRVARADLAAIAAAIRQLIDRPCSYRSIGAQGTRLLVCRRHRIVYSVSPDTGRNHDAGNVLILRILGPGQET